VSERCHIFHSCLFRNYCIPAIMLSGSEVTSATNSDTFWY